MTNGETAAIVGLGLAAVYLLADDSAQPAGVVSDHTQPPIRTDIGNHADAIATAQAELTAAGENLDGPCGAWKIIHRAAQAIGGGAGMVDKPAGNNCNGQSTDVLMYPSGDAFDCLADSESVDRRPQWNRIDPIDPKRWRQP